MLPSALSRSDPFSLGACGAFSIQPVLPSVWRPLVALKSGTWPRTLTQSPELGFDFCLFSSWKDFDLVFAFVLRSCCHRQSAAAVQWLVYFPAHPQMMQQHRQLSCRGHNRSLLTVSSAALRQFQSPAPKITVDAEWSQDMLRSLYQQRPQIRISLFTDVQLRFALS